MDEAELEELTSTLASGIEKKLAGKVEAVEKAEKATSEFAKKFGDPARWEEYTKKLETDAKELQTKLAELEKKLARPALGEQEEKTAEQKKAWLSWVRKGIEPEAIKDLATDGDSDGGYMVPEGTRGQVIEKLVKVSPIRANSEVQTISQGDEFLNPEETGDFGAEWAGEREDRPKTTTMTFGLLRNPTHELYAMPAVTQKMLDDSSFDVEGYIARSLSRRISRKQNKAFVTGTGVGQPEGILNADRTTKVVTSTSGALKADDVLDLIYENPDEFAQGSQIYAHRKVVLALRKLKDSNNQYLWQPSVSAGEPGTFAGVPVVRTPDLDDEVSAGKNIMLYANLQEGYQIVDKATVPMLRDPYTNKPFVQFYSTWRTGGRVTRGDAVARLEVKA